MIANPQDRESAISYLVNAALNYSVLSLDLEPSCWSTDNYTTECEFPTVTDVDQYRLLSTI